MSVHESRQTRKRIEDYNTFHYTDLDFIRSVLVVALKWQSCINPVLLSASIIPYICVT